MNNSELVGEAISRWLSPIVKSIGSGIKIPASKGIGKILNTYMGINLEEYNILNELDFIIEPTMNYIIKPQISNLTKMIPDEALPEVVNKYVDAAIDKAKAKGSVNIFGFEFEAVAFQNLKKELDKSFNKVTHDRNDAGAS